VIRIQIPAVALAIGLAAAPQAFAQSRAQIQQSQLIVCRDGRVTSTRAGDRACDRHSGIDWNATRIARRDGLGALNGVNGVNGNRTVYNSNGTVIGSNGSRSVYGNPYPNNGSNRSVYGGTVNGTNNGTWNRDRDRDDDDRGANNSSLGNGHGRGHAYGHFKHKHKDKDKDGDDRD